MPVSDGSESRRLLQAGPKDTVQSPSRVERPNPGTVRRYGRPVTG